MTLRVGDLGFQWCSIPAGSTVIGTDSADISRVLASYPELGLQREWLEKEVPRHQVEVPAFAMAKDLVTNAQFAEYAHEAGLSWPPSGEGNCPAVASFEQASDFANWVAAGVGLPVRLPSELEWERVARAGDDREFPWGDTWASGCANIGASSAGAVTPVGIFPQGASPFGPRDLAGNVEEWTSTIYQPYPGSEHPVPRESGAKDSHVTRGGSWKGGEDLARCARRHMAFGSNPIGIRLVISGSHG